MGNRRRRLLLGGSLATLVAVTGVLAGPSWAQRLQHLRDEEAFRAYTLEHVDGWASGANPHGPARDLTWVVHHPRWTLAQGDRACQWLADQPSAPDIAPSGKLTVDWLAHRYLVQGGAPELDSRLSKMGARRVVAGAWEYLCWSTRQDRSAPQTRYED